MTSKQELEVLFFEKKLSIDEVSRITDHCIAYIRQKLGLGNRNKLKNRYEEWGGYIRVRDRNSEWILEHRKVWKDHNGLIPEGWIIHHIDGDKWNNRIENLEAMPRYDHKTQMRKILP